MKTFQTISLLLITLLLNIVALVALPFSINSHYDGVIFTVYILLNAGIFFFVYLSVIDIVKVKALKGVLTNQLLLNTVLNLITDLVFKYKTEKIESYLTNTYPLIKYIPLSQLLVDENLLSAMKDNDRNHYISQLKSNVTASINRIEVPYTQLYLLIGLNILSMPVFFYLLNL